MTPEDFDLAIAELCDAIEGLLHFSRAGTFDEEEGEREATDKAEALLARYRIQSGVLHSEVDA